VLGLSPPALLPFWSPSPRPAAPGPEGEGGRCDESAGSRASSEAQKLLAIALSGGGGHDLIDECDERRCERLCVFLLFIFAHFYKKDLLLVSSKKYCYCSSYSTTSQQRWAKLK
jgi:hypothetical protein